MISTILVVGLSAFDRESAIANELVANAALNLPPQKSAILLEGLSDGKSLLMTDANIIIARIATGCLCCSNNMIMRTYLNRLIQQKPQQLFLSLSTDTHLNQIKQFLTTPSYLNILELSREINLNPTIS